MPPVITITTDFGLDDPFIGILKGVILNCLPNASIVDITHQVEPQNIKQAALILNSAYLFFPKNTVHLVVVDPGVGGSRRPIAAKSGSYTFVGPDNGVFTSVLKPGARVYELTQTRYFLKNISSTFHGRDIFAPATAWIAKGTPLSKMGRRIKDPKTIRIPKPVFKKGTLKGEIIHVDRFGNLITNLPADLLQETFKTRNRLKVKIGLKILGGPVDSYSKCRPGEVGSLINSWDHLEIFCREDNASKTLKAYVGTNVTVTNC